jgi:hypothetical protein
MCISLPHATEDIKYGNDLCFSVGNKIFVEHELKAHLEQKFMTFAPML